MPLLHLLPFCFVAAALFSVRRPGGFPFPPTPAESYFGPPECAPVK